MMVAYSRNNRAIVAVAVVSLFVTFHALIRLYMPENMPAESFNSDTTSSIRIKRQQNYDASLSVPFLDKINKYWHVGGTAHIRNAQFIRLTRSGAPGSHGAVLSNGIGDNTMDDFETVVTFRIFQDHSMHVGEGMAIVVTSENNFVTQNILSSHSKRQCQMNSGGVQCDNTDMMGFPSNLPGLAIVLDTFKNAKYSSGNPPFLDIFMNHDPLQSSYDRTSDGEKGQSIRLNKNHIKLKKNVVEGDTIKLRLIYLERLNFLKIDIQYAEEGDYWIELFRLINSPHLILPRNSKTEQRFIGISALTKEQSQTVDLLQVQTNEFHWDDGINDDESIEQTFDYAKELQKFFSKEYGQKVALEKDEFIRWKMIKAQPGYQLEPKQIINKTTSKSGLQFWKITIFGALASILYLLSVYVRVSMKHLKRLNNRRKRHMSLLPS